jgi:microcystin-dependent protein
VANHDYVIDNAPGINVREDMNLALQAIVTVNSGVGEPVTKYPGMFWLDLSDQTKPDGVIRQRNQANNAWLPLIPPPDGTVTPNLNADMLDGFHATHFATAAQLDLFVGQLAYFPCRVAPDSYLKVNGAMLLRTSYPKLWTFAQQSGLLAANQAERDANYALFGPGDGVNSFQLPDLRGMFLRAFDDGRGVDPGRTIIQQGGQIVSHAHAGATDAQGWHGHDGYTNNVGDHTHSTYVTQTDQSGDADGGATAPLTALKEPAGGGNPWNYVGTNPAGGHQHYYNTNGNGTHAHNVTVYAAGGNETRPINVSYPLFIRYR